MCVGLLWSASSRLRAGVSWATVRSSTHPSGAVPDIYLTRIASLTSIPLTSPPFPADICTTANASREYAVIGKAEGNQTEFHGHVTAITVAPEYRRLSLGHKMMDLLERVSDDVYGGFFVDLFVRCANQVAIGMYEGLGYSVYRRVREYYGSLGLGPGGKDEEDAFDMRKPLSRDPMRRSVRANGRDMIVSAHDVS
ncbi:hypothetical protein EWM64_g5623 [Hericium alpestre]|uniref:N-acetyltransferase domain-containing protein n=1 Tax=Hericium alpestre TaxID=135208 RepID=A0A4Y9ZUB1_9AGAM|nr:hypothetical protein EWM64_g5623 [Hericium alpestre]